MTKKDHKWSWTSALVGAAAATAVTFAFRAKPEAPKFRLVSLTALQLKLTGKDVKDKDKDKNKNKDKGKGKDKDNERLKFPRLDADLILTIHVTNPNILPVRYSATSLSIYYDGSLLGSAEVPAGSQPANSCQLIRLPARLNGLELAHHAKRFVGDVAKRKMVLDAEVDISGWAKAVLWGPRFNVHVDSHLIVDPLLLDVIDQENVSQMKLFV